MTRIQPFPAPCAEKARAALPRPAGTAVFVLTHEARSALCGRFGLEDSQLDRALGLLGAARVEDPDVPHGPIEADAAELLARLAEGRLPWFIHACPRWRRDVLRRFPQLSAFFSPARPAPCPARVAVVGCAARKAALAREGWTEALTVREAALRLIRGGVRPVRGMAQDGWSASFCGRTVWRAGTARPFRPLCRSAASQAWKRPVSLCWAAMCASRAYAEPLRWNACWGPSVPMRCPGR